MSDSPAIRAMNQIVHRSGLLGQWSATHDIARDLRVSSGEVFSAGRDDEAKLLRCLADQYEKRAKKLRAEYD